MNRLPDLDADLEWMVQSGQVEQDVLTDVLFEAWFERIFKLAFAFFMDSGEAVYATIETINSLLLNVHQYHSGIGIDVWIYRTIIDVFGRVLKEKNFLRGLLHRRNRKKGREVLFRQPPSLDEPLAKIVQNILDSLTPEDHLLSLLRYLLRVPLDKLAQVYKSDIKIILFRLQIGRSRLRREIEHTNYPADSLKTGYLDTLFERVLHQTWLELVIDSNFKKIAHSEISQQVKRRNDFRNTKISYQEFGWVGGVIVIVILLILGIGNLLPGFNDTISVSPGNRLQNTASLEVHQPTAVNLAEQETRSPLQRSFLHYLVLPGDTLERIAAKLGLTVQNVREANNIPANGNILPGQILVIQPASRSIEKVDLAFRPEITPTVLNLKPVYQIKQRMNESAQYYRSFWGEIVVYFYGPAGYIGPSRSYRVQVWHTTPGNYLLLGGQLEGKPDSLLLLAEQPGSLPEEMYLAYRSDPEGHWFFLDAAEINNQDSLFRLKYSFEALNSVLRMLRLQPEDDILKPSLMETQAGRDAILATLISSNRKMSARIWIDALTGVILREQSFSAFDNILVEREITFKRIQYDLKDPGAFFIPYNYLPTEFSLDASGYEWENIHQEDSPITMMPPAHSPLISSPAQPNFDVSKSWLIFQYPASYDFHTSHSLVELFADNHFLGVVRFGNPWTMICDRSPDGDKLAYVSMPDGPMQGTILNWFSLSDPRLEVKDVLGDILIKELVFAPNSQLLAVFGKYGNGGGIYIVDTASQTVQRLRQVANASSLVWSPDNQYIALIARLNEQDDHELFLVIQLSNGEIVYSSLWNEDLSSLLADAPVMEWGVPFPVTPQGLDNCAQPWNETR
jgi:LysM repeat protein